MGLETRVTLVTGAAGGIGAAISEALASAGAHVAIGDIDIEAGEALSTRISGDFAGKTIAVELDVSSSQSVDRAVRTIEEQLGPIDILVNNAGIDRIQPFIESTEETWDRLIATNLKGTILCSRAVLDGMLERRDGRIINIASDAGKVGSSGEAVYSATKGGVIAFTKALVVCLLFDDRGRQCHEPCHSGDRPAGDQVTKSATDH
ncbi:MAG: SDR family NAD(P)-dependent oxidoreductase [Acidimicrobiia bacterium]|nr:SDR family NAD(P)-dependent oxidoreductase [Acidimicrobiia bacterium]